LVYLPFYYYIILFGRVGRVKRIKRRKRKNKKNCRRVSDFAPTLPK